MAIQGSGGINEPMVETKFRHLVEACKTSRQAMDLARILSTADMPLEDKADLLGACYLAGWKTAELKEQERTAAYYGKPVSES